MPNRRIKGTPLLSNGRNKDMKKYKQYQKRELVKCPICNGKGELHLFFGRKSFFEATPKRVKIAKILNKKGFSLRQIAKLMGYNPRSPQSIKHLLTKKI